MAHVTSHGAFVTYLGGHGTMVYENFALKSTELVLRMTAKEEKNVADRPIIIHAKNVKVVNPVFARCFPSTARVIAEHSLCA